MMASQDWTELAIPGVYQRTLTLIADTRGAFMELWRAEWTETLERPIRQANLSRSRAGVLRGMHFHERQDDVWIVGEGRAAVALVDLRPTKDADWLERPPLLQLELQTGGVLLIPPGVAHGFLAMEDLALVYLVTNEYDGTDEHGFAWDDPVVGLRWPNKQPILSARDLANPSFDVAVREARQRGWPPTA